MPLYVYAVVEDDGSEGEVFEVLQGMSEPTLASHPVSGKPVRRLLSAPNALRRAAPSNLSDNRLESLGFTKYKKAGGGKYEKTIGKGPDLISKD